MNLKEQHAARISLREDLIDRIERAKWLDSYDAARTRSQREQIRGLRCIVSALIRQLADVGHVARVSRMALDAEPPTYTEIYDAHSDSFVMRIGR